MSYYEKRIAELEARVAQLAREQRMKAIPVEAKLLERYALMQAENSRLRKAGDWMAHAVDDVIDGKIGSQAAGDAYLLLAIQKWVKAKEGKQS